MQCESSRTRFSLAGTVNCKHKWYRLLLTLITLVFASGATPCSTTVAEGDRPGKLEQVPAPLNAGANAATGSDAARGRSDWKVLDAAVCCKMLKMEMADLLTTKSPLLPLNFSSPSLLSTAYGTYHRQPGT